MANKRDLKKEIKKATDSLIEDAFYQTLDAAEKEAKKMDDLIDKIVDERFDLINKINQYPLNEKADKVKAHFNDVKKELDKMVDDYTKKIGKVD
ncbi:MAG: hypothetical protein CMP59_06505 [Flavobacteriales bacterium]|nr:hypothetical protein [Flavobacteriales bacterium]